MALLIGPVQAAAGALIALFVSRDAVPGFDILVAMVALVVVVAVLIIIALLGRPR